MTYRIVKQESCADHVNNINIFLHTHREGLGDQVDISDLTWEQKEQVLCLLFSKMNSSKSLPVLPQAHLPLPPIGSPTKDETPLFITQSASN